jgi:hypothetical protein
MIRGDSSHRTHDSEAIPAVAVEGSESVSTAA